MRDVTGPLIVNRPMVAVVHDVSFRRHPEWFSPRDRVVLTVGVGVTVRRASAVVTLSEFSRREIAATCGVPIDRIHVTPLAAAPEFAQERTNDADVLARHGLRRPYLLAVGNLQPRKTCCGSSRRSTGFRPARTSVTTWCSSATAVGGGMDRRLSASRCRTGSSRSAM